MNSNAEKKIKSVSTPQLIELSALSPREPGGALFDGGLAAVRNVKTRLTVVAGAATVTIGELMALSASQILKLDSLANAPVDILLEGAVVARGQLVAVDDNFGVQITEAALLPADATAAAGA
ncbi:MAG TPA: FliM/FliN family flagellar motor switch protein [Burkholderiaceae bacterium]